MRAPLILLGAALALAFAACGEEDSETAVVDGPCRTVENPPAKQVDVEPPPPRPSAPRLAAIVATSCGEFEVTLATRENPKTTASFEHLAREGVYDDTPIHRIAVNPPVIQGGDPQGTGTGDAGYSVDEPPATDTAYTRGVVAMAKTSAEPPGRSGSQFFVVTAADAGLPPDYAVVGKVTKGFDVVTTISQYGDPSGESETPLEPVVIESVTIDRR